MIEVFGTPKKRLPVKPRAGKAGKTAIGKENKPSMETKIRESAVVKSVRARVPRVVG